MLVVVLYLFNSSSKCFAESVTSVQKCGKVMSVFGGEYFCVINRCGNMYNAALIDESGNCSDCTIGCDSASSTYAYLGGTVYIFEKYITPDSEKCVKIKSCELSSGFVSERVIENCEPQFRGTFAVDSSGNYYMINNFSIEIYSRKFLPVREIKTPQQPLSITSSPDGKTVYAVGNGILTIITGETQHMFEVVGEKIFSLGDNKFMTDCGEVYSFDGSGLRLVCSGFDSVGVGVIDNCMIGSKNRCLTILKDEREVSVESCGGCDFIASAGSVLGCFYQNGDNVDVRLFTKSELESMAENAEKPAPPEKTSDAAESSFRENENIRSEKLSNYKFNSNNNYITGVAPGQTVAQMKKEIGNGEAVFYKDGSVKTSGKIGTGWTVEISGEELRTFTVLIYGELSGEGNINTSDRKILIDHLTGKDRLGGVFRDAADVNGDSAVDLKDLVVLDNYLKGKTEINQER